MEYVDTLQCVNNRITFQQQYKCAVKLCSVYFINIIVLNVTSSVTYAALYDHVSYRCQERFTSRVKRAYKEISLWLLSK